MQPSIENDDEWAHWRDAWSIRADTIYLNHGSFGPSPRVVQQYQLDWQQHLATQPMDFFVRRFEPAWLAARKRLAEFVGVDPECIVFMENSTAAMNTVASSLPLQPGDEVLLTDHEYGAVGRIWRRACQLAGTVEPRIAKLPNWFESADQVVDAVFREASDRTRCLVVSHITSPTAVILPVQQICVEAKRRGISICIDGPHAPVQVPLVIDELGCDFYTASLHKWVSAPMGSGFLFVAPHWHERIKTPQLSWGRLAPAKPNKWWEEFVWPGTRDPSAFLASEIAIDFLEGVGLPAFRARTHYLARYARECLVDLTGLAPATPDDPSWYGSMVSVPLQPGDAIGLQRDLWQLHGIEVPVIERDGLRSIRVSCHLYNDKQDIDSLVQALGERLSNDK